jgi:hypothetical protein
MEQEAEGEGKGYGRRRARRMMMFIIQRVSGIYTSTHELSMR